MLHPKAYQIVFSIWGSNPRPSAHKTDALPTELTEIVPAVRFELTKLYATELESAPFDRSGILVLPYSPKSMILNSIIYNLIIALLV